MAERKRILCAAAMVAAALALSGCAATHVGEDWQCPLAQGSVCSSVAGADPAVPETLVPETPVPGGGAPPAPRAPLYGGGEAKAERSVADAESGCEADCGPFAWFRGLLGLNDAEGGGEEAAVPVSGDDGEGVPRARVQADAPSAGTAALPAPGPAAPVPGDGTLRDTGGPPAAAAEADNPPLPAPAVAEDADLRTGEVIGRVWIAPFVDSGGVYREGSWVRLVIEPARWRAP